MLVPFCFASFSYIATVDDDVSQSREYINKILNSWIGLEVVCVLLLSIVRALTILVSEPFFTLGRTRSETKGEMEEKIESNSRGIFELKEWMIEMSKTIDLVAVNVQNLMNWREKEGLVLQSGTFQQAKSKEDDEGESSQRRSGREVDRSKYKRLEMPIFSGENPNSWLYRA